MVSVLRGLFFFVTCKRSFCNCVPWPVNRGILVYNICLISISNSVYDVATYKSVLNIEGPLYD